MPTPVWASFKGKTQGPISQGASSEESVGNMAVEDHADECRIIEVKHNLFLPRDPASGQPTGQRVHEALSLVKVFDKASPLLRNALATGETLDEIVLKFYRTSSAGSLEHYMTWSMAGAICVGIRTMVPNVLDPQYQQYGHLEEASFSYADITWTHEVAGTEATDSFRTFDV